MTSREPRIEMDRIEGDHYIIEDGRVSKDLDGESWVEPLANYQGVCWRQQVARRRQLSSLKKRRDDLYQEIDLRHLTDPKRDIHLYRSTSFKGVRARWQNFAKNFKLPALREMNDGCFLRRFPSELNMTLRELARSGKWVGVADAFPRSGEDQIAEYSSQSLKKQKLNDPNSSISLESEAKHDLGAKLDRPDSEASSWDPYFTPKAAPPAGVCFHYSDGILKIYQRQALYPYLLIGIPALLFGLFVGFMVPADPVNTVMVIGSLCLLYALWISTSFRIVITPTQLKMGRCCWRVPLTCRRMLLEGIEEILTTPGPCFSAAIQVESERKVMRVSPLSDRNARWLLGFVRFSILTDGNPGAALLEAGDTPCR